MNESAALTVRDFLKEFIDAPTWGLSRQIVIDYQAILLSDLADAEFARWIAELPYAEVLAWYQQVLRRCRLEGISATFDHLPEPRPLNKAFQALLQGDGQQLVFQVIHDFPEIMSDEAMKIIQGVIIQLQATNQEVARKLAHHFLVLEMVKAAHRSLDRDLTELLLTWMNTDTWEESRAILEANAELLLSEQAFEAFSLWIPLSRDGEARQGLLQHWAILRAAREKSIEAAYIGLLKPSLLLTQLHSLPDDLQTAACAMMMVNSPEELFYCVKQYPVLLTPRAVTEIEGWLDGLRQADQEAIVHFVNDRYDILKQIIALKQTPLSTTLEVLLGTDTPHELREIITQDPLFVDDSMLDELAAIVKRFEQLGNLPFAQALRLRLDEVRRIQKQQREHTSSSGPLSTRSDERVEMYAENSGIAILKMHGNIYQIDHYNQQARRWQPPPHQTLPKTFVGRQDELDTLRAYLAPEEDCRFRDKARTILLHGMGGIGKTYLARRLAIEFQSQGRFSGGVIWIDVGPQVTDDASVQVLLRRLASYAFGGTPPLIEKLHPDQVAAWLEEMAPGSLLVVFDDVWPEAPLHLLLRALPADATRLITTRDASMIHRLGGAMLGLEPLNARDGLALLEDRLNCRPDTPYRAELEELVTLLGGHALALDIATARIQSLSWARVVAEDLRKGIGRGKLTGLKLPRGEKRNEDLEKSLALSYNSMTEEQQYHFRMLGAFAADSPITPKAAAAVWGLDGENGTQYALFCLRDMANLSVLTESDDETGTVYYQHNLLHIYAYALLEKEDELTRACWTHAHYYLALAGQAETASPQKYALLDTQIQNLLIALQWTSANELVLFSQLVETSSQFLRLRGQISLLETYLPQAVSYAKAVGNTLQQAHLLESLADLKQKLGNIDHARAHYASALLLYRAQGCQQGEAYVLKKLGNIETRQSNVDQARIYFDTSLPLFRAVGDPIGEAYVLQSLGELESQLGNLDRACLHYNNSLLLFRMKSHRLGEAESLLYLGKVEYGRDHFEEARGYYAAALPLFHAEHNRHGEANLLFLLGVLEQRLGHLDTSRIHYNAALEFFRTERHPRGEANVLQFLGHLELQLGNFDQAHTCYINALSLYHALRHQLSEATLFQILGVLEHLIGKIEQARTHFEIAGTLFNTEQYQKNKARVLIHAGELETQLGNMDQARIHYEAALPLFGVDHNSGGEAYLARALGELESNLGNIEQARTHYETALSLYRRKHNQIGQAVAMRGLADLESRLGNIAQARAYYDAALRVFRAQGDQVGEADLLRGFGDLECACGNFDRARMHYDAALPLCRNTHSKLGEANTLRSLGDLERQVGDLSLAHTHFEMALSLYQGIQNPLGEANSLRGLGDVERLLNHTAQAQCYYDSALLLYEKVRDRQGEAYIYRDCADMFLAQREWAKAKDYYERALRLFTCEQDPLGQAYTLIDLGRVRFKLRDQNQGIQDIQRAAALFRLVHNERWARLAEAHLTLMNAQVGQSITDSKDPFLMEDMIQVLNDLIASDLDRRSFMLEEYSHMLHGEFINPLLTILSVSADFADGFDIEQLRTLLDCYLKGGIDTVPMVSGE